MSLETSPPTVSPQLRWMTTSDGAKIPFRVQGSGRSLVMIHGWSQSGAMFQHQLDTLSTRFEVVVPDMRGHGESPNPGHGLRMSRLGKDLAELLDHLELDRSSLLGWSMGVSVVWAYIDLFGTSRIEKLVLVDQPAMLTILPGMGDEEAIQCGSLFTLAQMGDLYSALSSAQGDATRASFVKGMVTNTITPELFNWILAEDAKTSTAVAAALFLSHCTHDWRDVLSRIDRPTLVIGGSVSHVNPRSQKFIQSKIVGALYHEFSAEQGGAHFPFLEAPDAFNRLVGDFLSNP